MTPNPHPTPSAGEMTAATLARKALTDNAMSYEGEKICRALLAAEDEITDLRRVVEDLTGILNKFAWSWRTEELAYFCPVCGVRKDDYDDGAVQHGLSCNIGKALAQRAGAQEADNAPS